MGRTISIKNKRFYKEDYQMKMLRNNQIEGLLPVTGKGVDQTSVYEYDTGGKQSMETIYRGRKISGEEIRSFLAQMTKVLKELEEYLLDIHHIVLNQRYIFNEKDKYYFCYYPAKKDSFWESFHTLSEFFVKHADYKDPVGVRIIFLLHKETMEENYSLEKLLEECEEEMQEKASVIREEVTPYMCETPKTECAEETDPQEEKSGFLKRTIFRKRRQKDQGKWGSWEKLDTLAEME